MNNEIYISKKPYPYPYKYDDLLRIKDPNNPGKIVMAKIKNIDRMHTPTLFSVTTRDAEGWNLKFVRITEQNIIKNFGAISYNTFKIEYPEYVL